jgi:ABC-2 type transport system permease protein
LTQQITAAAEAVGTHIDTVDVTDEANGRAQVASGTLEALAIPLPNGRLRVVVESELAPTLQTALSVASRNLVQDSAIRSLGGDPAEVNAAVASAGVTVEAIKPPKQYNVQQLVLGGAAGILIYLSLMIGGQLVAQGVVEEKSSRVVELLLATVRPWELMVGKVLGIGALGMVQIVLYGVVGVGLASALGTLTLSLGTAAGTVIWLIVWYLVGFVMYAFAFAAAGALVSRMEDAAGVIMPITSFVIVGYVVGISVLPSDPGNSFAEVLSIIPLFAPTLMPMRLAMGGVPVWEAALSLLLALATIPLLAALAGRIYRNAVIHIGSRVPLRKALARS